MLRIAASIASGAFRWGAEDDAREGERIPCSWESSGDEEDAVDDEDDFGIPLRNLGAGVRRRDVSSASSELD
ncbi:hypothetical protein BDY21DRAFT_350263 [Lineolata rhizophorae]|uniref:Uncharacterized protein n=1 Tax=Lineolata rhizophorae TaxID=578093 RepID=A0A6A6NU07_9PEZI|nr:hypothetical protein BDY21DRAFT_350263 [Lineolata rhizophorae]